MAILVKVNGTTIGYGHNAMSIPIYIACLHGVTAWTQCHVYLACLASQTLEHIAQDGLVSALYVYGH